MEEELFDFRSWIQEQCGAYEANFTDRDHFALSTDYAVARINFYNMDPDPEVGMKAHAIEDSA